MTETKMPDEIWLSKQFGGTVGFESFAGGVKYIRADIHSARVEELHETANAYLERARKAEEDVKVLKKEVELLEKEISLLEEDKWNGR